MHCYPSFCWKDKTRSFPDRLCGYCYVLTWECPPAEIWRELSYVSLIGDFYSCCYFSWSLIYFMFPSHFWCSWTKPLTIPYFSYLPLALHWILSELPFSCQKSMVHCLQMIPSNDCQFLFQFSNRLTCIIISNLRIICFCWKLRSFYLNLNFWMTSGLSYCCSNLPKLVDVSLATTSIYWKSFC